MTTQEDTTAPDAAETPATIQTEAVQADAVKTPTVPEPTFADFNVHPDIVAALAEAGIIHPFPIQSMTLAVALGGHDIIGQAKTGTGKTLGFGIPMIQNVISPKDEEFATLTTAGKPQALAVVPTRELAVQVAGDLETASSLHSTRVLTVYGGRAYEPQVEALRRGVEVVVGTPGRLLDLADPRSAAQRAEARDVAAREARLATRLEAQRRQAESSAKPPGAASLSPRPARKPVADPSPGKPKTKTKKAAADEPFIATVPRRSKAKSTSP